MTVWKISMSEVLELISTDYHFELVGNIIDHVDINDAYHKRLARQMRKDGINKVPIYIDGDDDGAVLRNGHHRVRIAYEAGWTEMLATDSGDESGWHPDLDRKVIGSIRTIDKLIKGVKEYVG